MFAKKACGAERGVYKLMGVDPRDEMTVKKYALSVLVFSGCCLALLFAILMLQSFLPFNPEKTAGMSRALAFNTAASFVTNINRQAYAGETQLGYFAQMLGLTVQNFLSGAAGVAVLFALCAASRGGNARRSAISGLT